MEEIENKQVNQNNITSNDTGHGKHKAGYISEDPVRKSVVQ